MLLTMLAVACAMALAWWSWRDRLPHPVAWAGAVARSIALTALLLLCLDPSVAARRTASRPLVLVDHSVSMVAHRPRADSADRVAASLGDTVAYGLLAPGIAGNDSRLMAPLAAASATGRAVIVVTDGEIPDAAMIPPDLLAQATVRVVPRTSVSDIALTDVRAPSRIAVGDTLTVDVDAARSVDAPDSAVISLRDSLRTLVRTTVHFVAGAATGRLRVVLPPGKQGTQWLRVTRDGPADGEPDDDVRWLSVQVTPTPAIIVLAATPDFDARALYRALQDVLDAPVRGFVQLRPGQWWRMDNLHPVAAAVVRAAARRADLLAVRGDVAPWRAAGHARLLWPPGTVPGDWYLSGAAVAPVSSAFAGVADDSLPPAAAVSRLGSIAGASWVGVTARLARQGAAVPVMTGQADSTGRTVTLAADGLFRWPLRGGVAQQAWRTMISDAAAWLLAEPSGDSAAVALVSPVTPRGDPVRFRWIGSGIAAPVSIRISDGTRAIQDTLRFDASGRATLALPVGRYRYAIGVHDQGTLVVEPYSPELFPSPVTLTARTATVHPGAQRRSLRDVLWLFAIAMAAFATEWVLRRRAGLQ